MKFLFLVYVMTSLLYGIELRTSMLLGTWELSSSKSNGFVRFGKDRAKKRGEVWLLEFRREGQVLNKNRGNNYIYFVEDGALNILQMKVRQQRNKILYSSYSEIKNQSKMFLVRKLRGKYSNCYLMKVETTILTQYRAKERFRMCKVQNEAIPVFLTKRTKLESSLFD